MPEPTYLNDPKWVELVMDQPRIADALFDCMSIQPEVDPEAGFGALQPVAIWLDADFGENVITLFDNPYKLYLFLRASNLLCWNKDQLAALIAGDTPPNYMHMLQHVCGICKHFNASLVLAHLTENDHGSPRPDQRQRT